MAASCVTCFGDELVVLCQLLFQGKQPVQCGWESTLSRILSFLGTRRSSTVDLLSVPLIAAGRRRKACIS